MRRVDPKFYTKKYYLEDATGYGEYKISWGKILEPRLKRIVREIPDVTGKKVLDIGCGRGELALWAAENGAKKVVGIDYSRSAIILAKEALSHYDNRVKKRVKFMEMDAKILNFKSKSFDAIFMTEVLEHLYPEEQEIIFKKIKKIIKSNGFIFIHTAPSKWFNDITYKLWCYPASTLIVKLNNLLTGGKYENLERPENLRPYYHKIMHVNEPDYLSLRNLFRRHGLYGKIGSTNVTINKPISSWKDALFNLIVYLYSFSMYFPLNIFWGNDFYAVLRNK